MNSNIRSAQRDSALLDPEALALLALTWIASDEERLIRFLNLTGMNLHNVKESIADLDNRGAVLGAILDYLMGWEPLLIDFANEHNLAPESIAVLRRKLPYASLLE